MQKLYVYLVDCKYSYEEFSFSTGVYWRYALLSCKIRPGITSTWRVLAVVNFITDNLGVLAITRRIQLHRTN